MKQKLYLSVLCVVMLCIFYTTTNFQYQQTEFEARSRPFDSDLMTESYMTTSRIGYLPRGIVHSNSDMELKPLWVTKNSESKEPDQSHQNLLGIPVGIKQKKNVDAIVSKFLPENFTVILFHYDGNVDGWHDLHWSNSLIHIAAPNQTKWWFAKRFLHPDVVSIYDYIFLWDEDLGVENFHPGRYLQIMKSEGLEISQPALDPKLSEIHHRITIRRKKGKVHRRVHGTRGSGYCSNASEGPPCTGWVEGMAPVFSRAAWRCAWYLIQNDLIHGWGMDMKLGYCAQGDRTKKVGVIDSEYIVHQGVETLGGSSNEKKAVRRTSGRSKRLLPKATLQMRGRTPFDARIEIRRQAKSELQNFQERWDQAAKEDKDWVDPFRTH
ncbi:uncharacterized protein [Elaeis guineensis]|uniref:Uncharacterized protein LOC105032557 isoform X2 n=1 Tax=Elaeis guineensis var. tenera TaxID=51953 RepID=A0A6I9QA41_ELAGV|nr:uncharacterized protein LOC105032557 isoform X2 [Elaeis guineensis]XP_010905361.1 uncharacterized protein LOC105032557 isoform X2 [Elaeis guineensis]XP_029116843.1 uncharacterized protein LOC105032557 isoform X2 [Elaeis guineensis]